MDLDLGHGRLHYESYGEGETVVFLNGFASGISNWYPMVRKLKGSHRCVVYDYVGTGDSAGSDRTEFSLDAYCDDLASLLAALGQERVHLVGYSMGGWIAQHYAARNPGGVRSMALVNTSSRISIHQHHVISHFLDVLRDSDIDVFSRLMFISYYSPAYFERNSGNLERIRNLASATFAKHKASNWSRILASCLPFDASGSLAGFPFPMLLVSGETDFLCPRMAALEYGGRVPALKWVELPSVGHAIPMERHRELGAELSAFLHGRDPA